MFTNIRSFLYHNKRIIDSVLRAWHFADSLDFIHLFGPESWGGSLRGEMQTTLSLAATSGRILGVPKPGSRCNLSSLSWVCSGISFQWNIPETPPRVAYRRHSDQMPKSPWLVSLSAEEDHLYFEFLPDVGASHLMWKAEPSLPVEGPNFGPLYSQSHSFHWPEVIDSLVKTLFQLSSRDLNEPL